MNKIDFKKECIIGAGFFCKFTNVNFPIDYALFSAKIAMQEFRKISCQIVTKTPTA